MPLYRLECTGTVREIYEVAAEDEDHAREKWQTGQVSQPSLSEASTDIDSITLEEA